MIRLVTVIGFFAAVPAVADTLVATRLVRPNSVIMPGDIDTSQATIPGALTSNVEIVGLEARITLYPGRPIMPAHVGPAALIERNQPVKLVFQRGGLRIETEARALARGAVGDVVRVMNLSSRTTVSGRVQEDGSIAVSAGRIDK